MRVIQALLVVALLSGSAWWAWTQTQPTSVAAAAVASPNYQLGPNQHLTVYYFHGSARCTSCVTIEQLTREAVEQGWPELVQQGQVELRSINVDLAENRHYIDDFQLVTRSVVVSLAQSGTEPRWRRLDSVWQLFNNRQAFFQYLYGETGLLVTGAPS
ncbi:nitrophenyl compound nitroreductase subunit ArsF family protein [Ferrimonas kyonanensis]|uniref:nitrophenyl compound nitroreductase subunit ArsF family protein n=1 Tax=Ferrimonas kyonanensis TaxID=364763 RepID=UPI00040B7BE5|nr:nitrophenyl compound nitroreductase subunit ArsF family protein [Ferrimonas kyonanensis]